jgi:hypothetical protein
MRRALAQGELIDAGPAAREGGFRWPVTLTAAAWEDWEAWSESDSDRQTHQDQSGRLWDVLFLAAYAARVRAVSRFGGLIFTFADGPLV